MMYLFVSFLQLMSGRYISESNKTLPNVHFINGLITS